MAAKRSSQAATTRDVSVSRGRSRGDKRDYSLAQLLPTMIRSGVIENPDEVLRQFGGYEGIRIYLRMMRQFPFLGAPMQQRTDPVLAIPRSIVAGDENSEISLQMARDARAWWKDVREKDIVLRKLLMSQFIGFSPIEMVWGIHASTGLLAPVGESGRGDGLFEVPAANIKFTATHEPRIITTANSYLGEPVEPGKLFFARWGSNATPFGEGEFKDIYLATWYMQVILEFGIEALEQLGRPIPLAHIPRNWEEAEVNDFEAGLAEDFKLYMTMPTDAPEGRIEFPGVNVAAGGNAGRAEQEWLRYLENWIWNRLLSTTQTQDRGGAGNGKLEEQRSGIKSDKTSVTSSALDGWITDGPLEEIGQRNWPNQPRALWPRCDSDATEIEKGLTGIQLEAVDRATQRLTAKQITQETAEETLASVGIPRPRVMRIVTSTIAARDKGEITAGPEFAPKAAQEAA